ncbi:MAG: tyrosine-type recombinase/integrase [Oligoflexales bacterium]
MNIEMKRTKRGKKFRARFMVDYTAFMSPWLGTKDKAKEWAAAKRMEVANGQAATGSAIPVSGFVDLWLQNHAYARKTQGSARRDEQILKRYLVSVLGKRKLSSVTVADVNFLFADLLRERRLAPKSVNNVLGIVKRMFKDAVLWGYLSSSPAALVQKVKDVQKEVTIYFDDEVSRLLLFTNEFFPEYYPLFVFSLNTGCRLGECLALRWGKVCFETSFAHISATYDESVRKVVERTKGKRFRKVPLNDECLEVLRKLVLQGRKNESEFIFSRIRYEDLTRRVFKRILLQSGLHAAEERGANFHP